MMVDAYAVEILVVEDLFAEEEERNTFYLEFNFFDEEWELLEDLWYQTDGYKVAHWNKKQAYKMAEKYKQEGLQVVIKHVLYR